MDGGDGLYSVLADRCQSLEASHEKLKQQLSVFLQETDRDEMNPERNGSSTSGSGDMTSYSDWLCVSGAFYSGSLFGKVLEDLGHAVLVRTACSDEIIYWNRSAERLYGYKSYEALGQTVKELLIDEEHHASAQRITERVMSGQSWSGQFPFRKRSGQVFVAMVTESPYYEGDKLVGVITVSSDAAIFNNESSLNGRTYQDPANGRSRVKGINLKGIQWQSPPQIASSVSHLASRVLSRRHGDNTCSPSTKETQHDSQHVKFERPPRAPAPRFVLPITKNQTDREGSEKDESTFEFSDRSKIAAKVLSKLHLGGFSNSGKDKVGTSEADAYCNFSAGASHGVVNTANAALFTSKRAYQHVQSQKVSCGDIQDRECSECFGREKSAEEQARSNQLPEENEVPADAQGQGMKPYAIEDNLQQLDHQRSPNSIESTGSSRGSSSSKGDHESNLIIECEIQWEDLNLHEEIGQGSYAVVYRGTWNGSDVAVKVYHGTICCQETLHDYKKEINIMRRLRHPNVLLFMGAVYSEQKLAVVTEYLPRGSLFKILHKGNHLLDIRRRLRMALDVARGMNYLHRRKPPIVHRDLKSSNLLVDKSWTIKVGDFGLSKLMNGSFLTTKSGRGTPQWMAPEVLRNEPSTEKSDVFSFGVILWELITESIPWKNLNSLQVVGVVGFMDRRLDIPENVDPRVSAIINDCWQSKPECRPSFEEIIQRMADLIRSMVGVAAKASKGGA